MIGNRKALIPTSVRAFNNTTLPQAHSKERILSEIKAHDLDQYSFLIDHPWI